MCDRPVLGYTMPTGVVVFSKPKDYPGAGIPFPCTKCVTCRLRARGAWITRGMCEARFQKERGLDSYMVTFTYAPEHLPPDQNLDREAYRLLIKRIRRLLGAGVRFQGVGEYGHEGQRPHMHISLFGASLTDLVVCRRGGFRSAELERIWPYGHVDVIRATPQTVGYVAGHQLRDLTGVNTPDDDYMLLDPVTGEMRLRVKPFRTQSNRPGIGSPWFRKYWRDCVTPLPDKPDTGWIILDGEAVQMPDSFLRLLRDIDRAAYERIYSNRLALAADGYVQSENMPDRRAVRSAVRDGRLKSGRDPRREYGSKNSTLLVDLSKLPVGGEELSYGS